MGQLLQPRALRSAHHTALGVAHRSGAPPAETPQIALDHPTFLYESSWNVAVAMLLLWVDRRFSPSRGKLFALYVAAYTLGRGAIEALRVDHANHFFGLRLNDWTSLIVFLAAMTALCWPRRVATDDYGLTAHTARAAPKNTSDT